MEKNIYITDEEREKCRKVAAAFADLEDDNILVVEAGRFGFLRLLYYKPPYGFDDAITYTDSQKLFDDLWEDWLYEQVQKIAMDFPELMEIDGQDMFKALPVEKQRELMEKRHYFVEKAGIDETALNRT